MRRIRAELLRFCGLFNRRRRDRELYDELESHLQLHIEDNLRAGMDSEEARRRAHIMLGGVEATKERYRDRRGLPLLEALTQDLRYSLRSLGKNPGFTIVAALTLALGIGSNTAVFSVMNSVVLNPLGYKDPDRLVRLWEKSNSLERGALAYPNYRDWKEGSNSFEAMAAYRDSAFSLTGRDDAERISGRHITFDFLSTLGAAPALGRDLGPDDDRLGANLVVLISDGLWTRRFGRDPSILGKNVVLNDDNYAVIGVLPPGFHFYSDADVLTPLNAKRDPYLETRAIHPGIQAIARLRPDVSIAKASADLGAIAARLGEQYPDTNKGSSVAIASLYSDIVGDAQRLLLMLLVAVGLVLLIACANVANLTLARAASREREIAIRAALGASRSRVARMLVTESLLLALLGGGLGLLTAFWGTGLALRALPSVLPRAGEIKVDIRVLLFTLGASILTGVVFGLAPALRAARADLNDTLKEGGRTGAGGRNSKVRTMLAAAEIALALILLVGSGLLVRSIANLRGVNPGFDPANLLSFRVSLAPGVFSDGAKVRGFYRDFLRSVGDLGGVQAVAATSVAPLNGYAIGFPFYESGRTPPAQGDLPTANAYLATSGYLETMRIPLIAGRFFDDRDTEKTPAVTVIDENLAKQYFPGEDPVGRRLTIAAGKDYSFELQIIGIVGHVKQENLDTQAGSMFPTQLYTSLAQLSDSGLAGFARDMNFVVRTGSDPAGYLSSIRSQLNAIAPNQVLYGASPMQELISNSLAERRFVLFVLGLFSIVALALASVGVYGLVSYSVAQRTHEIGIRIALGAGRRQVLAMVLGDGAKLAALGIGLGAIGALIFARFVSSFLFGVSATDPATFVSIASALAVVALVASFVPARRALRVDPMLALRHE